MELTVNFKLVDTNLCLSLIAIDKFYEQYNATLRELATALAQRIKMAQQAGDQRLMAHLLIEQINLSALRIEVLQRHAVVLEQLKVELP